MKRAQDEIKVLKEHIKRYKEDIEKLSDYLVEFTHLDLVICEICKHYYGPREEPDEYTCEICYESVCDECKEKHTRKHDK